MPSTGISKPQEKVTFDDIARWARDDGHLMRREMLAAVREVIGQAGVKLKIAGVVIARNQLARLQRFNDLLDGDGGLTQVLFAKDRIKHMRNDELIRLWAAAAKLRYDTETTFVKSVLDPDTKLAPDPDEVRSAFRADEVMEAENRELERRGAHRLLSDRVASFSLQSQVRSTGLVTDPPVVR